MRLVVVGFIRVRVGSLARAKGSSGSFCLVWVHSCTPRCLRVDSDSRGFTKARLGVVGFIRVRVSSLGHIKVFAWDHSGAPSGHRGSLCSFGREVIDGLIRVRLGSLGHFQESFGFALVHSGAPRGRLDSLGFTWELSGVVGFIWVSTGSLWRALGSPGSYVFPWNALTGRRVHSRSRGFILGVVGFSTVCVGSLGRT